MEQNHHPAILHTKNWINNVVIGLNLCPFAARPFKDDLISYQVELEANLNIALQALIRQCIKMDSDAGIETSFIIFPNNFIDFFDYLDLVEIGEKLMVKEGYEGIYQIASFHPLYQFAETNPDDPENYTNRSPYPILHILREESLEIILSKFSNSSEIPEKNIETTRKLGLVYMKELWKSSFEPPLS